jgi:hypothetical protein
VARKGGVHRRGAERSHRSLERDVDHQHIDIVGVGRIGPDLGEGSPWQRRLGVDGRRIAQQVPHLVPDALLLTTCELHVVRLDPTACKLQVV